MLTIPRWRAVVLALFAAGASSPVMADPSAETIVANYVAAIGGPERLVAVRTIISHGTYIEGSTKFPATVARMRPFYKLVGDPRNRSKDFEEGYDGSAWEYYGKPGIVLRTVGAPSETTRHSTAVLGALADWQAEGASVELEGRARIAGRDTWQVRLKMRDGYTLDEFIDVQDWRLTAEREVAQVHAVGDKVRMERRFGDFRQVGGVLIPFESSQIDLETGHVLNRFIIGKVEINVPLTPADFSPPEFTRTPAQGLIEALYAQRDDPGTLLWTLFDFRRAHADISTDELCRIAGYQMVKAGSFRGALALLEQNVRDYPDSAAAASSLGRAYANAGDKAAATTALKRALELAPHDQRARAALERLGRSQSPPP